ncbi:MAG: hypothetical protein M0D54_08180 [Hyphomonadaceae bacterium JAD_PAG50586_4]|nr:MAG: hypothetical protein M0D54_08180 [Hyphomonadaceae bacterium JAD_PAG50586_4]
MTTLPPDQSNLLPHDALKGVRLGISVSESPDLARLGLLEMHFTLALGEIARCVLVSGGKLAYGGSLRPDGYTPFLVQELHRYSRRDRPLLLCLGCGEHRTLPLSALAEQKAALGLIGSLVCLDADGNAIDPAVGRSEQPEPPLDVSAQTKSLTSLRRYLTAQTQGRILLGGRREGFHGDMPGVLEEAIIAIESQQPIYLAGGFGGVTIDIVGALSVDDTSWLPQLPNAPANDVRLTAGLGKLQTLRAEPNWPGLNNGLSDDENVRLARTYRPSEIAALISLGLGRLAAPPSP